MSVTITKYFVNLQLLEFDVCVLYLRPLHRSCVFVTHGADLHPPLPLSVSLVEELVHDPVSPLPVQIQRLGRVAQVGTVNHVTQNLQRKNIKDVTLLHLFHVFQTVCIMCLYKHASYLHPVCVVV